MIIVGMDGIDCILNHRHSNLYYRLPDCGNNDKPLLGFLKIGRNQMCSKFFDLHDPKSWETKVKGQDG